MENKILKLNLNYDANKKIESIVVVRKNNIETETNPNYFDQFFNNLLDEIKNSSDEYKNLSKKELKEKLINKGFINQHIGPYIVNMEKNGDDEFTILYSDRREEIVNKDSRKDYDDYYNSKMDELREYYGDVDFEKLGLFIDNRQKEKNAKKENKDLKGVKNIKITKKLVALVTTGAVLLMGASGYVGHLLTNRNSQKGNDKPQNNIEWEFTTPTPSPELITVTPTVTATPLPTPTPTVQPTSTPTVQPTPTATPIIYNQPEVSFTQLEDDPNSQVLAIEIYDGYVTPHEYSDSDFDCSIDNLVNIRLQNTSDLASHINNPNENPDLITTGTFIFYEKFFQDQEDRAYIEYFSKIGNEIIYHAFFFIYMDTAREYIQVANYEIVRCIRDLEPVKVNINGEERYVTYDDLTPNAKQLVLNIAYATSYALTSDNFEYNNEIIDKEDTQMIIIDANNILNNNRTK